MSPIVKEDEQVLARGAAARSTRTLVESYVSELEQAILERLISGIRSGSLTNEDMRGKLGQIAGLWNLRDRLDRDISQMINTRRKVTEPPRGEFKGTLNG